MPAALKSRATITLKHRERTVVINCSTPSSTTIKLQVRYQIVEHHIHKGVSIDLESLNFGGFLVCLLQVTPILEYNYIIINYGNPVTNHQIQIRKMAVWYPIANLIPTNMSTPNNYTLRMHQWQIIQSQ